MRNILFSTTRQWNVGDEFILFGTINLLKTVFPEGFNPIIYNRHPDLRTDIQPLYNLHDIKIYMPDELTAIADANFRIGFRDNSFKITTDGQFIDLVVFAGTPEWSNSRCFDLYEIIEKFDLPVIGLGIGNQIQDECDLVLRNLKRFKLFTVRSPEFIDYVQDYLVVKPQYLPCPSLCSSEPDKIRSVESVNRIGLIYSCDKYRSEINNCVSTETYNYLLTLFRELKFKYPGICFSVVCHYIDELPFAHSDFPDVDILYSFDAKDYYEIYNQFDMVIGARVHGIGCAASMGIPGICISHDFRGETAKGFFAEMLDINQPLEDASRIIEQTILNINERSKGLREHIKKTEESYITLISQTLNIPVKSFGGYHPSLLHPVDNIFESRPNLFEALRELRGIPNPKLAEQDKLIAERDKALAERDNAIAERDKALAERDNAMAERDKALAERDNAMAERDRALAERDNTIAELDNTIVERDIAVAKCENLYNSTSWKITAPARAIFDFLKSFRKGIR